MASILFIVRRDVKSYRQLPVNLYHIQTKFRDDPRPRAGLIRVREFTMKDSYSLDADWGGLDRQYRAHYQAYFNIFRRCGLPVMAVKADVGMMGGHLAHEFMYLADIGEDTLLRCGACGFSANRQVATFRKAPPEAEAPLAAEKVATPGCKSIEDLANFLGNPKSRTAKAVFLMATIPDGEKKDERLIFAVIRGDMEVNETKLANAVKAQSLRPATEAEIRSTGAVPGYASPVGLKDALVIVDDAIPSSPNLVAGPTKRDTTCSTSTTTVITGPRSSPISPPPSRAMAARAVASPWALCAASRWAISSSWGPTSAMRWAAPTWTPRGSRSRW
jgi:prolyl-tRNA synthetase